MKSPLFIAVGLWVCLIPTLADSAQINFAERKAVIISQPGIGIALQDFSFGNSYETSSFRLTTNLGWKNVSKEPITAFEVVILRYDPFNRPMFSGGRWLVTGRNSGDWSELQPGETSSDGLVGYEDEPVFTSVVYVRAIRYSDGTVWSADIPKIEAAIRVQLPVLKQLGDVSPAPEKKKSGHGG